MALIEFIARLQTMEQIFENKDISHEKGIKLQTIKHKKSTSLWWKFLKDMCQHKGKNKIIT